MPRLIRILLVEQSADKRHRLRDLLSAAEDMAVVGEAATATSGQRLARALSPGMIVVGGVGPESSLGLVKAIMETAAAPIIVVTSPLAFQREAALATTTGATAALAMPSVAGAARSKAEADLVRTVRTMAGVGVVTRRPGRTRAVAPASQQIAHAAGALDIVAIGASTGGPQALFTILSSLPADFPVPVLIVQHMAVGFLGSLLQWLNRAGGLHVRVPTRREPLADGVAYLAPDELHMGVDSSGRIELSASAPVGGLRPAVSYLFHSVRQAYGARCVGVLLTGMGRDGADELKLMRDAGGTTIAQDEASSVVYGMPREAVIIGGATYQLGIENVAQTLLDLTGHRAATKKGDGQHG